MPTRRKSRQRALQILFIWDSRKLAIDEAIGAYYDSLYSAEEQEEKDTDAEPLPESDNFMEALARGTAAQVTELDGYIAKRAEHWRLERMPVVDRNILRLAIYELTLPDTPPAVVIDEALELARRYSEEEAVPFVNGVLDAVRKLIVAEREAGCPPSLPDTKPCKDVV